VRRNHENRVCLERSNEGNQEKRRRRSSDTLKVNAKRKQRLWSKDKGVPSPAGLKLREERAFRKASTVKKKKTTDQRKKKGHASVPG